MLRGRQKAAEGRRKESVVRVKAFRAWLDADAEYWRQYHRWTEYGESITVKKPRVPAGGIPSDYDYQVAREEGAIS